MFSHPTISVTSIHVYTECGMLFCLSMAVADPGLKQVVLRNSTWNGFLALSGQAIILRGVQMCLHVNYFGTCRQIMVGETCLFYHSVRTCERASLWITCRVVVACHVHYYLSQLWLKGLNITHVCSWTDDLARRAQHVEKSANQSANMSGIHGGH